MKELSPAGMRPIGGKASLQQRTIWFAGGEREREGVQERRSGHFRRDGRGHLRRAAGAAVGAPRGRGRRPGARGEAPSRSQSLEALFPGNGINSQLGKPPKKVQSRSRNRGRRTLQLSPKGSFPGFSNGLHQTSPATASSYKVGSDDPKPSHFRIREFSAPSPPRNCARFFRMRNRRIRLARFPRRVCFRQSPFGSLHSIIK